VLGSDAGPSDLDLCVFSFESHLGDFPIEMTV
jgi:hypothetical protein